MEFVKVYTLRHVRCEIRQDMAAWRLGGGWIDTVSSSSCSRFRIMKIQGLPMEVRLLRGPSDGHGLVSRWTVRAVAEREMHHESLSRSA